MHAAVYCRVSTAAQEEEGTSLDTQEAACRKYAAEQGWDVDEAHMYREQWSGFTRDRPGLTKLRTAVREHEVAIVLVYSMDRLSRNQVDTAILIDEILQSGARLDCVTESVEHSSTGTFLINVRAFIAEREREFIRERTMRGRRMKAEKEGQLPTGGGGNNLYGYTYNKTTKRREINPATAPIVQQVFHWIGNEGMTLYKAADRLNALGIATPTGKAPLWKVSTLSRMLANPAYTGETYAYRRFVVPSKKHRPGTKKHVSTVARPIEEQVLLPDATPQLISPELWQRVQERLIANQRFSPRNAKHTYLLRGRIVCDQCGAAYTGRCAKSGCGGATHFYYRCGRVQNRPDDPCTSRSVVMETVDAAVWEYVKSVIENPALIMQELERQREAQEESSTERDLAVVRSRLEALHTREQRLVALALDVEDDSERTELFAPQHHAIREERERLRIEEKRLEAILRRDVITDDTVKSIEAYCEQVRDRLTTFDTEDKRMAFDALNIHVKVLDGGKALRIEGRVPTMLIASTTSRSTPPVAYRRAPRRTARGQPRAAGRLSAPRDTSACRGRDRPCAARGRERLDRRR